MQGLALVQAPQSRLLDHTVRQEHVTAGQELHHASAAWHSHVHITQGSGGREARQGQGNMLLFKIEVGK